jgi:transposase
MSKHIKRFETIIGMQRRRRYSADEKIWLVEQTMQSSMTVSAIVQLPSVVSIACF